MQTFNTQEKKYLLKKYQSQFLTYQAHELLVKIMTQKQKAKLAMDKANYTKNSMSVNLLFKTRIHIFKINLDSSIFSGQNHIIDTGEQQRLI